MGTSEISRRNFIRASGIAGTALCLGFYFPANAKKEEMITASGAEQSGVEMNAWIRIGTDGKVTLEQLKSLTHSDSPMIEAALEKLRT